MSVTNTIEGPQTSRQTTQTPQTVWDAIVQERTPSSIVFRLAGSFSEVWLPVGEASEDLPVGAAVRITCELREGERVTEVAPVAPQNLPRSLAEEGL